MDYARENYPINNLRNSFESEAATLFHERHIPRIYIRKQRLINLRLA